MSSLERVQVLENLATARARTDDLPGAMSFIGQAFDTLKRHSEISIGAKLDVINYRQDIQYQWGRYAEIEHTSPDDIRECDRHLSPHSATCLKLKLRLQLSRLRLGLTDEAQALNADLAPLLDPSSPRDQLAAASAITRALARGGQLATQPEILRQLRQLAGPGSIESLDANFAVVALNALAEIELLARQPDQALGWVAEAERLTTSGHGVVSAEIHRLLALKGLALSLQGQNAVALATMAPLCSAAQAPAGMARVQDRLLSLNCVPALVALGDAASAVTLLQQALPVLRESLGSESRPVHRAQQWLDALQSTHALPAWQDLALTLFT
jgi:hypothetical protein